MQPADIGDSEKRLVALQEGSLDVAVTVADVTYQAFHGRLPSRPGPLDGIRGIALVGPTVVHPLVGPATNPSLGFRGMRVVLGDPRGSNAALGERLINSIGIGRSEMHCEFIPRDLAVEKLSNGDVDAVITTGGLPQETVVWGLRGGAHLLDIDGPVVDCLRMYYHFCGAC